VRYWLGARLDVPLEVRTVRTPQFTTHNTPVETSCSSGVGSPPWPSDRRVMVTRRVASLMKGALKLIIFMYYLAYGRQFAHFTAYITAKSSSTSSTACPVGVQFLPWKGGGSALRCSCGRDHVHTFHRSTSSVGLAGADGEFPVTRAATKLMHTCEETIHCVFPCFVAFSLSLLILVGLGSQLLDG